METTAEPIVSLLIPAYNEEQYLAPVLARVTREFRRHRVRSLRNRRLRQQFLRPHDRGRAGGRRAALSASRTIRSAARATPPPEPRGGVGWCSWTRTPLVSPELIAATLRRFEGGKVCAGGAALVFGLTDVGPAAAAMLWTWNRVSALAKLAAGSYVYCYRQAWEECGGFDEAVYAGEEIYFSRRLKRWARGASVALRDPDGHAGGHLRAQDGMVRATRAFCGVR